MCETSVYLLYFPRSAIWQDLKSALCHNVDDRISVTVRPLERNIVARAASVIARVIPSLKDVPILQLRSKLDNGLLVRPYDHQPEPAVPHDSLLLTGHTLLLQSEGDDHAAVESVLRQARTHSLAEGASGVAEGAQAYVENFGALRLQQEQARTKAMST